jgi:integrase
MIVRRKTTSGEIKYLVRVMDANRNWYPSRTFNKKVDAEAFERSLFSEKAKGARLLPGSNYTLKQYWDKWKGERRTESSSSWKETQERLFKYHIAPDLEEKVLTEITKIDISNLLGKLKEKGLSSGTRLHIYIILNKLFRDAIEFYEILLVSPVRKDHRPKLSEIRRNFLKPNESRRFLNSVVDHQYGIAYWIMLGCGLRIGEVQGLKHGDLDLEQGVIHLKRQWHEKELKFAELKNRRETVVQMPTALVEFLKSKLSKQMPPEAPVVTNSVGNMAERKKIYSHLKRACKAAGVKELCPHELRHSCTELWIEMGASIEDLRRLLNHKSSVSTQKYIHHTPERLSRLATQINMNEDLSDKIVPLKKRS